MAVQEVEMTSMLIHARTSRTTSTKNLDSMAVEVAVGVATIAKKEMMATISPITEKTDPIEVE